MRLMRSYFRSLESWVCLCRELSRVGNFGFPFPLVLFLFFNLLLMVNRAPEQKDKNKLAKLKWWEGGA